MLVVDLLRVVDDRGSCAVVLAQAQLRVVRREQVRALRHLLPHVLADASAFLRDLALLHNALDYAVDDVAVLLDVVVLVRDVVRPLQN